MKSLPFSLLLFFFLHGFLPAQNSLGGTVTYFNTANTLIHDSCVVGLYQGNVLVYSDIVHTDGTFLFENITPGTYVLKALCSKAWGGGNATDAILVLRHFVGLPPLLTGLKLKVSDVNGSGGTPASADCLAIARRFVGMLPNFMPPNVPPPGGPDWYSDAFNITIGVDDILTQNIHVLCAGDANGSFVPF